MEHKYSKLPSEEFFLDTEGEIQELKLAKPEVFFRSYFRVLFCNNTPRDRSFRYRPTCACLVLILLLILCVFTLVFTMPDLLYGHRPAYIEEDEGMLIDTQVCKLKASPVLDEEISWIYRSNFNKTKNCGEVLEFSKKRDVQIRRFESTKLQVEELKGDTDWSCNASHIRLIDGRSYEVDTNLSISMGDVTDFEHTKWDSVRVDCWNSVTKSRYDEIVLLVQDHINRDTNKLKPKFNVMLLALDSISRLNAKRHLPLMAAFYKRHGFIELTGYHKVGKNTYPNLIPILTGRPDWEVYNDTWKDFRWDNVTTLLKEFQQAGYTTTFIEDNPSFGLFRRRGGFAHRPTNYYTLEAQLYISNNLTHSNMCYKDDIEFAVYYQYFVDMLKRFSGEKEPVAHFSYLHMSTLTHDLFNNAGLADVPFLKFLESVFATGQQKNTVIVSFSDHAIRFGDSVDTDSYVHEANLPYIHIYIPDSLKLDGKNAAELRAIVQQNRKRLTSHFDIHATFRHILYGAPPTDEPFGISLLTPIPTTRHCSEAGVLPEYCMCNSYQKLSLPAEVMTQAGDFVVDYINRNIIEEFKHLCVYLRLKGVRRMFESIDGETSRRRWLVVFTTSPNNAMFEAIIDMDDRSTSERPIFAKVIYTSRMSYYGNEPDCLGTELKTEPYCYCRSHLKSPLSVLKNGLMNLPIVSHFALPLLLDHKIG